MCSARIHTFEVHFIAFNRIFCVYNGCSNTQSPFFHLLINVSYDGVFFAFFLDVRTFHSMFKMLAWRCYCIFIKKEKEKNHIKTPISYRKVGSWKKNNHNCVSANDAIKWITYQIPKCLKFFFSPSFRSFLVEKVFSFFSSLIFYFSIFFSSFLFVFYIFWENSVGYA